MVAGASLSRVLVAAVEWDAIAGGSDDWPKKNKPLAQISSDVSLHFERQGSVAAQHIDQSLFQ